MSTTSALGSFEIQEIVDEVDEQTCFRAVHRKLRRDSFVTVTRSTPSRNAEAAERYVLIAKRLLDQTSHALPKVYTAGLHDDVAFLATELVSGTSLTEYLVDCDAAQAYQLLGQALICAERLHSAGLSTTKLHLDDFIVCDGIVRLWRVHGLRGLKSPCEPMLAAVDWGSWLVRIRDRATVASGRRKNRIPRWAAAGSIEGPRRCRAAIDWLAKASGQSVVKRRAKTGRGRHDRRHELARTTEHLGSRQSWWRDSPKAWMGIGLAMAVLCAGLLLRLTNTKTNSPVATGKLSLQPPRPTPTVVEPETISLLSWIDPKRDTFGMDWKRQGSEMLARVKRLRGLIQLPCRHAQTFRVAIGLNPMGNPFGIGLAVDGERIMLSFRPDGPQRYRVSLWARDSGGQRRTLSNRGLMRNVEGRLRFRCSVNGRRIQVAQQDAGETVESNSLDHILPTHEHYALDEDDAHYPCTTFVRFTAGEYRIQKLAVTSETPPQRVFSADSGEVDRLKRALWRGAQVSIAGGPSPLSGTPFSQIDSFQRPIKIETIEPIVGPVRSGLGDEDFDWLSRCNHLRTLDLRDCEVTEAGLGRLRELEALETLILDSERHDVSAISMIRPGKSLTRMMLPEFRIRGQDMPCFRSLGQLTYLCLNRCTLDSETANRLPSSRRAPFPGRQQQPPINRWGHGGGIRRLLETPDRPRCTMLHAGVLFAAMFPVGLPQLTPITNRMWRIDATCDVER
jgi:hypothetical protein